MSFSQTSDDHLFCSPDGLIRVIDIPRSIAHSQNLIWNRSRATDIFSNSALEKPYPSTEPKSDKARLNVLSRIDLGTQRRNLEYTEFIGDRLDELKNIYAGPWIANRIVRQTDDTNRKLKRKSSMDLSISSSTCQKKDVRPLKFLRLDETSNPAKSSMDTSTDIFLYNVLPRAILIRGISDEGKETNYSIPASSAVYNSSIHAESVLEFEANLERLFPEDSGTTKRGQLDIILMDPPWINRSVKRSDQYSTLHPHGQHQDPLSTIEEALPRLLAARGLLAIWVTNKASTRQRAMEIFKNLGIEVIEEWIWLKVTTKGQPVYTLDGIFRQPWEVCLVGRRGIALGSVCDLNRRLIVACPDLHSRKPAIGRMLFDHYNSSKPHELRKLEIFARYVSAGWCTWGDEALKFNDTIEWVDNTDSEDVGNHESLG